jgi:hypothetical protein
MSRRHEMELSCEQTIRRRGVCEPALEPRGEWEGSRTRCQDFKPDLGNSAVRHYRGASENVAMVEMRTQLAIERAGLVTLHLQPARRSSIPTIDRVVSAGSGWIQLIATPPTTQLRRAGAPNQSEANRDFSHGRGALEG